MERLFELSNDDERSYIALTTLSMIITGSKISDLCSLDTLGIKDPIVRSRSEITFSKNSFFK